MYIYIYMFISIGMSMQISMDLGMFISIGDIADHDRFWGAAWIAVVTKSNHDQVHKNMAHMYRNLIMHSFSK